MNHEKGFFHCFGCSLGGDVFKFLELQEKMGFPDAVRHLAAKFGIPIPESVGSAESKSDAAEREALLKVHERAADVLQRAAGNSGGHAGAPPAGRARHHRRDDQEAWDGICATRSTKG